MRNAKLDPDTLIVSSFEVDPVFDTSSYADISTGTNDPTALTFCRICPVDTTQDTQIAQY